MIAVLSQLRQQIGVTFACALIFSRNGPVIGDRYDAGKRSLGEDGHGDLRFEAVLEDKIGSQFRDFVSMAAIQRRYRTAPEQATAIAVRVLIRRYRNPFAP